MTLVRKSRKFGALDTMSELEYDALEWPLRLP
jgi:hypothetical protein